MSRMETLELDSIRATVVQNPTAMGEPGLSLIIMIGDTLIFAQMWLSPVM